MAGLISGEDIQKILSSTGPVVKCVLLRAAPAEDDNENDSKPAARENGDSKPAAKEENGDSKPIAKEHLEPAATEASKEDAKPNEKVILKDFIDEIEVDTTPKKSEVQKVMGGPITFLGQYEDEDLVVICRLPETLADDTPMNLHQLQPPFENTQVQGDILIMRVAKEEEKMEHEENGSDVAVPSEDFFLDFTKEDYIKFAERTDVEPPEFEEQVEEEEEEEELEDDDDDDEEDEEDYVVEDDEDGDDGAEAQVGMMNLIMGQVLRRFHEENGRGPDTRELLELRSALAQKLGIELPEIDGADDADEGDGAKPSATGKRAADEENGQSGEAGDDHEAKRVKFSQETEDVNESEQAKGVDDS